MHMRSAGGKLFVALIVIATPWVIAQAVAQPE